MSQYSEEIERRRTFAIISHPDAGKTTLTEKLLLFGGAIHVAGAVKSNKIKKTATSDWMEIEKKRYLGYFSVLQFNYDGYCINILDTPGHQDFFGGYLPYPDGSRFCGDGYRCIQGCRGTDEKAV